MSGSTSRWVVLLALGCGACAGLGSGARAVDALAVEREVLMYIIREHGRGAVLRDSTEGGAPRAALRDLLPAEAQVTYASELPDQSAVPCKQRRGTLGISRVRVSPGGDAAVVSYSLWIPMDHLGCGAVSGRTVRVRRARGRGWEVGEVLQMVVS